MNPLPYQTFLDLIGGGFSDQRCKNNVNRKCSKAHLLTLIYIMKLGTLFVLTE